MSLTPEQSTLKLTSPYKGLMPYTEEDADYFFGREVEEKIIAANLMVARLTLLYGESGVGKSSVLRAGVVQTLVEQATQKLDNYQRPGYVVVVFSSWQDDPVTGLLAEVEKAVTKLYARYDLVPPTYSGDLAETLAAWTEQEAIKGKLLIILDQFEEYFLYHPQETEDSFVRQFSLAVNQTDLKVNFLISIREDQLSKLDRFKGRIPGLFENYIRIDYLNREAAGRAIVEPVKKYNQDFGTVISLEPELVEKVLDELEGGKVQITSEGSFAPGKVQEKRESGIETPYLQLVMIRLWDEEMRSGSGQIRLATLEKLKGAEQIVRSHLDEVLATLTPAELAVAARIFRYLATPNGSKIAQSAADLAEFADLNSSEEKARLGKVLEELSSGENRILRPVQSSGGRADDTRYEIFHDVLGKAILEWRRRYTLMQQQEQQEREAQIERETQRELERKRRRQFRLAAFIGGLLLLLLMVSYIGLTNAVNYSREASRQRDEAGQQRNKAVSAEATAIANLNEAEKQRKIALSRQLAAQARNNFVTDSDKAFLLSLEAINLTNTSEAKSSLIEHLLATPQFGTILGHTEAVLSVSFSPNGNILASSGVDKTVRLWDMSDPGNPQSLAVLTGHSYFIKSAVFSPDNKTLVSASCGPVVNTSVVCSQSEIRLWDISNPKNPQLLTILSGQNESNITVLFSPDNKTLATAGCGQLDNTNGDCIQGKIRLWDVSNLKNPQPLATLTGYTERVNDVAFSPDGKILASASCAERDIKYYECTQGQIRLWDVSNPEKPEVQGTILGHVENINSVVFNPNGNLLASASDDNTVRLWDVTNLKNPQPLATLTGHKYTVNNVVFSPDGKLLASAGYDKTIRVWDIGSPDKPQSLATLTGHTNAVEKVVFSPDGKILASAGGDKTIRLWQTRELGKPQSLATLTGHTNAVGRVIFSPDGKILASTSVDGTTRLWDISSPKKAKALAILANDSNNGASLAFSPDGKILAFDSCEKKSSQGFCMQGEIQLRDMSMTANPPLLSNLSGYIDEIKSVVFSPDGKLLASGSCGQKDKLNLCTQGEIRLWDVSLPKKPQVLAILYNHSGYVSSVAFSADGKTLASTGGDNVG